VADPDIPSSDPSDQSPLRQTYWRPEWNLPVETQSETDPALLKQLEAHISWAEAQSGLGKMLVKFQLLETTIKEAIAFLINGDDLNALVSYHSKNQTSLKVLREILKKCDACCKRRNEIVHSLWYPDRDEGVVVRFEIRVSRGTQPYDESAEVVATKVLELDAKECELTQRELHLFMIEQFPSYELSYRDIPDRGE
jgi:hypothetical protein